MKRIMNLRNLLVIVLAMVLTLSGCGNKTEAEDPSIQKVLVGTEGTYKPFNFKDEDGNIIGYDIDVLREVERRTDDMEIEFIAVQWDSMFLGLETGKYDMVADELVKTPEREEKYIFTENSYFAAMTYLIARDDEDSITSLDDLAGKTIGVSVATLYANILEEYNKENNDAIDITYYEGNITSIFQDVENGRLDAAINDKLILNDAVETLGLKLKTVGEPIDVSYAYFMLPKTDEGEALRAKIDAALTEMKSDGSLEQISIDWFGENLT
jgi:ABC-type amino acid transport substrate-binding protein